MGALENVPEECEDLPSSGLFHDDDIEFSILGASVRGQSHAFPCELCVANGSEQDLFFHRVIREHQFGESFLVSEDVQERCQRVSG